MRIFKNAPFRRFATKHKLPDELLFEAVERIDRGQIDADLGSGVFKQRIARSQSGRRSGFRTIVIYRNEFAAFFIYGYAKNDLANISRDELKNFKKLAAIMLSMSDDEIDTAISTGSLWEARKNGD